MNGKTTSNIENPAFWDDNADYRKDVTDFTDFTAFYSECAWELVASPPGSRILDIAAGAGALTQIAANAGYQVLATDFSRGMVDAIADLNLPGVEARVMDGQALDIADASFDVVFSMFGIMLFPDWKSGLREAARVTKPGGTVCIGTWAKAGGAGPNLLMASLAEEQHPDLPLEETVPGMVRWTQLECFAADLTQVGLADLQFHQVTSDFRIDAAMLEAPDRLFQFSPVWPLLTEVEQADIVADLKREVARDGAIPVPSPAIIALGTKPIV